MLRMTQDESDHSRLEGNNNSAIQNDRLTFASNSKRWAVWHAGYLYI